MKQTKLFAGVCAVLLARLLIFDLFPYPAYCWRESKFPLAKRKIAKILLYPIKSCSGISVREAKLFPRGLEHDREWAIVYKTPKRDQPEDAAAEEEPVTINKLSSGDTPPPSSPVRKKSRRSDINKSSPGGEEPEDYTILTARECPQLLLIKPACIPSERGLSMSFPVNIKENKGKKVFDRETKFVPRVVDGAKRW